MPDEPNLARYVEHLRWEAARLRGLLLTDLPRGVSTPLRGIVIRLEAVANAMVAEIADG